MKTIVIGASPNEERFSNKAVILLNKYGHEVIPLGIRNGSINGIEIETERKQFEDIHTVTMYVGKDRQPEYYEYVLGLKPERIIFNPGTENDEFRKKADEKGIETVENCTLVMLNS